MAKITIEEINLTTYKVVVVDAHLTTHTVTVGIGYALSLTASKISTEHLINNAFEFLLAREPNTSILKGFELSDIGRFFPEFEEEMRNKIA
jgi:hypothetical protein